MTKKDNMTAEEKKLVNTTFLHSLMHFTGSDNVAGCGTGFALAMLPALKKLYKDRPEEFKEAFARHFEYYNTHSVVSGLIVGIALAMEKKKAEGGSITGDAISKVKTSLMGPLAGIGDSFFYNCVRAIIAAVAIGLGATGNVMGPLFFFVAYFGIQFVVKYILVKEGYLNGTVLIDKASEKGLIPVFTKCAGVVGLVMVGYMIATTVKVKIALAPVINGVAINFQTDIFDVIAPGILSLIVWYIVFRLVKKGVKPTYALYGMMIICIFLSFLGVL